ncbi:hypothetical protein HA402_013444 [Bradysia odoriphaga]|nr:hypothetical protein HA402_013444 [Bradysia odoriphaga]
MKMKSTNTVRRNIRRKKIGKYLTKAVKNQTEASLENLASQANRQVYPAANRNLNRVVRVGFIIKREKKLLSLSSRQNYETDYDATTKATNKCLEKRKNDNCIVQRLESDERCEKIDLITLRSNCLHKKYNDTDHCLHHDYVYTIFQYKILFYENIGAALQGYVEAEVKLDQKMTTIVQELLNNPEDTKAASTIYVEFLQKYRNFINLENFDMNDKRPFIPTVLYGMKYKPPYVFLGPHQCHGIDLATGCRCDVVQIDSMHCKIHRTLHMFHKLFTHEGDTGDGFHQDNIEAVLNNVPEVKNGLTDKQKQQLSQLPKCLIYYMSGVTRLEDQAISQFPDVDRLLYYLKIWTTLRITRDNTNESYEHQDCICQCVTNTFYVRLGSIRHNIDKNVIISKN